jgi:hypothetical protein
LLLPLLLLVLVLLLLLLLVLLLLQQLLLMTTPYEVHQALAQHMCLPCLDILVLWAVPEVRACTAQQPASGAATQQRKQRTFLKAAYTPPEGICSKHHKSAAYAWSIALCLGK